MQEKSYFCFFQRARNPVCKAKYSFLHYPLFQLALILLKVYLCVTALREASSS